MGIPALFVMCRPDQAWKSGQPGAGKRLRNLRDAVHGAGGHGRVGHEVIFQRVGVHRAAQRVGAQLEGEEVVAAVGQEAVHGDPVAGVHVQRHAVDHDVRYLAAGRGAHAPGIGEALGDLQDTHLAHGRVIELLLQDLPDLIAGHRLGYQAVAERLDGERLAIGDVAVAFAGGAAEVGQVGTDAAGVHESHNRVAEAGIIGGVQLSVGDDIAQGGFAGRIGGAQDVTRDLADDPIRQRGGDGVVPVDEAGHPRVLGDVAGDDDVVDADRLDLPRSTMDEHVDVGHDSPKGRGAGHRAAVDHAVVSLVRVAGDEQVDFGVGALDDIDDGAGNARALVVIAGREATLMNQNHDGANALPAQALDQRVDRIGLILEPVSGDARRGDDARRPFEGHADEGHLDAGEIADPEGREQRPVGALVDHVGGEILEARAPEPGVALAAVNRVTTAVLHALQFRDPFIELVVAHGVEVQPHLVKGFDGRFVMEQRRQKRRGPDHVAGRHHNGPWVCGAQVGDMGRQVFHAAGIHRPGRRVDAAGRTGRRHQVAVEVIHGQNLNGNRGSVIGRGRRDGDDKHHRKRQQDQQRH